MRITKDEFGDIDIPGYACEACDATMIPKNLEKLDFKEVDFNKVFKEFKNKNF
jgi:hypothetical protein